MGEVIIEQLARATPEAAEQLSALLPQLTAHAQHLDEARLQTIVDSSSALYVARVDGAIVGTVCRVDMHHPVRTKCWIEDLVVDKTHRGKGIARSLMEAAIAGAPAEAVSVNLNSNVARVESHQLYKKLGFIPREETRIWLLELQR